MKARNLLSKLLILILFLSACKSKTDLVPTMTELKERSPGFLIRHIEKSSLNFKSLGMKIDANLILSSEEEQGFKSTVRMRRDSALSLSVSPALGIEMLRALVDKDSVKIVSEIPGDKWYFTDKNESLSDLINIDIDISTLQDLLIGNAIGLSKDEGKMKSTIEGNYYLLSSKLSRRLKKATGLSKDLEVIEEIPDTVDWKVAQEIDQKKNSKRLEDNDWISSRFWVEPNFYKIAKCEFFDLRTKTTVIIEYSEFDDEHESHYPRKVSIKTGRNSKQFNYEIIRLTTESKYTFDFYVDPELPRKSLFQEEK